MSVLKGKPGFSFKANPSFRTIDGRFVKATVELINSMRPRMTKEGFRFKRIAKEETPKKTGELARSIRFRSFKKGEGRLGFRVYAQEPLMSFVQLGTKPHVIRPKRPGYPLRFFWPRVGKMVHFMSVNHPGTKPNPVMGRAFRRWIPGARAELMLMATKYSRTIAGKTQQGVVGKPGGRR